MLSTAPDEDAVCPACDEIPSEWNVLHLISHEATLEYPRWQQVR